MKQRIGLVGVGLLGEALARRMVQRGWSVTAWDRDAPRLELAGSIGAATAHSPKDVIDCSDVVILCVLDTEAVRQCVFGAHRLAGNRRNRGKLLIDMSTIDPQATRDFAARAAAEAGLRWVDAPVSGGPAAALDGALTIMVGGSPEDFRQAEPVLRDLGAQVTLMGPCGSGQTAKIINQAIVGVGYALMTEAVLLAEAAGIDVERLPQCLSSGLADSVLLQRLYPRIAQRDFDAPTGYARQLLKDLKAVTAFARNHGEDLPLVECAQVLYSQYVEDGHGMAESASLIRLYERAIDAAEGG